MTDTLAVSVAVLQAVDIGNLVLSLVTLGLVLATAALAFYAARQTKASRDALFVQAALSLWARLEEPEARGQRRRVLQDVIDLDPASIDEDEEARKAVEAVAVSFDYLGTLSSVDKRLRALAVKFDGVPAVRCWAVIRPYVQYMRSSGRRAENFHEPFREFAEAAALDPRIGALAQINGGHDVWIDAGEGDIRHLSIWDDEGAHDAG